MATRGAWDLPPQVCSICEKSCLSWYQRAGDSNVYCYNCYPGDGVNDITIRRKEQ